MATTSIQPAGFVSYAQAAADVAAGDSTHGVIAAYPLTSQPAGSTHVGSAGTIGLINYNSDGLQFIPTRTAAHYNGVKLDAFSASNLTKLKAGGHIAFNMEVSLLDSNTYDSNQNYLIWANKVAAGKLDFYRSLTTTAQGATFSNNNPSSAVAASLVNSAGKGAKPRFVISWSNYGTAVYVDDLMIGYTPFNAAKNMDFDNFHLGGQGTTYGGVWGARMSDFHISTQPIMLPIHPKLQEVAMLGHSFTSQGGYIGSTGTPADAYYRKKTGYNGEACNYGDASISYAIHRKIMSRGYNMGGQIWNVGYAGSLVTGSGVHDLNTASTGQVADLLTKRRNVDIAIIIDGVNDLDTLVPAATLEASYKTAIDSLVAAYPRIRRIYITNVAAPFNDATYDTAAIRALLPDYNTAIASLESYSAKVKVLDIFTPLGGMTPNTAYFQSADLHCNGAGFVVIGNLIGNAILADL